ncbi:TetR/AcrR family transcriptional regulator [Litoreibacter arenae]|uniref:Transcriptional regulator, TetR family n=1 Tax=Litoreibacter arenae DSM 19593 TaxID=1123360 RepID=S9Q735_9RHOB|nr:TetR/AcrR family transcriptional regulator [Litoreibacter arenae]EPX77176.1 Transcriptional regulator, TetR family [Litoreibacter arenae DSM 19593]
MSQRKPAENRRIEILTATLDLAFKIGPDHVTTGMVAHQLGLTQPAIYKHFPKKEFIWQAIGTALIARIHENIDRSNAASTNPMGVVRCLILGHLNFIMETPALPEIMVTRDPSGNLATTRRGIQGAMNALRACLKQHLESAISAGDLREDLHAEDAVMLLIGVIQSLALRLIVTRDPAHLVQDGERLLDLQLMLLASEGNTT